MKPYCDSLTVQTDSKIQLVNITEKAAMLVRESGIEDGTINLFVTHTTAAIMVNEDEKRLTGDFADSFKELVSWSKRYAHNQIDDNAPAHIVAGIIGSSLTLPVRNGKLALGTWQAVFLVELDGPRSRQVEVTVSGIS